ncbi:MAG TPA: S24/S26 family peptidase [Acidobacteriota bacterium]|nr:S24/S26 family peptidase [Acidobacteriota bacterium]HQM64482.1 S24/S26 family peptidase [Acidobacteriota bacterium]
MDDAFDPKPPDPKVEPLRVIKVSDDGEFDPRPPIKLEHTGEVLTGETPDILALDSPRAGVMLAELLSRGFLVRVRVTGRSMRPALPDGAVVHLVQTAADPARFGDMVLTLNGAGRLRLHRVLFRRQAPDGGFVFRTKGDAAAALDPPASAREVLGRVVAVERRGAGGVVTVVPWDRGPRRLLDCLRAAASLLRAGADRLVAAIRDRLARTNS